MKKILLWACIVIGGIALLCLLVNLFIAVITISLWLLRIAGIVLLICMVVIIFNAVKNRLSN